ncbi:hypothetical protein HHL28_16195 [Aerophototrophica crusticola]|uniref:Glycosyl transferase n=1 Tax=Aerophototrophica crusticola TaxID=1709002 RepID=A0A858RAM8_9PROT|nr:hypothetical protein HHL28_16195 [Rhodospirillaceae bacterium B3]
MTKLLFWAQPLSGAEEPPLLAMAGALAGAGFAVTLAWGGVGLPDIPGVAVAPLPPAVGDGAGLVCRPDTLEPVDNAWKKRRAAATLAVLAGQAPSVILLDRFPRGHRAFRFDLRPFLHIAARRDPAPLVASWLPPGMAAVDDPALEAELGGLVTLRLSGELGEVAGRIRRDAP